MFLFHLSRRFRSRRGVVVGAALAGLLPLALVAPADAATYQLFSTPGTARFTVPSGVSAVTVHVVGAGGGGGGSGWGTFPVPGPAGGGGGGGANASCTLAVTPGTVLDVTVGAGGAKGVARVDDRPSTAGKTAGWSGISIGTTRRAEAGGGSGGGGSLGNVAGGAGGTGATPRSCAGGVVTTNPGANGAKGGDGVFNGSGGAGGVAGTTVPAECPANSGRGGNGANGGVFSGYDGDNGSNGCVVIRY
ncbi:hypothetical protein SAMN05444320_105500 [Streptoalloteichus hindustanus]|uniref:Glycine-rich domain-containing protein n=1 Tax=Streptoalloteichus hindustanus TaxID=2017 RepID=A0A1M5FM35_STRHI|nr:hypothetical protein SAMN05444320_105500 [Streptoalloteichus hindustanus]